MKAYYIVLVELERCMPLASCIPSDEPIAFYKLLLAGHTVEPYLGNPHYIAMLRGVDDAPPAVLDEDTDEDRNSILMNNGVEFQSLKMMVFFLIMSLIHFRMMTLR